MPRKFSTSSYNNLSSTIQAGGVAQQLVPFNRTRTGFFIENLSTGDLYINEMGTASSGYGSIRIPSGALYESPTYGCPVNAISIYGASTGQAFTAREY